MNIRVKVDGCELVHTSLLNAIKCCCRYEEIGVSKLEIYIENALVYDSYQLSTTFEFGIYQKYEDGFQLVKFQIFKLLDQHVLNQIEIFEKYSKIDCVLGNVYKIFLDVYPNDLLEDKINWKKEGF